MEYTGTDRVGCRYKKTTLVIKPTRDLNSTSANLDVRVRVSYANNWKTSMKATGNTAARGLASLDLSGIGTSP